MAVVDSSSTVPMTAEGTQISGRQLRRVLRRKLHHTFRLAAEQDVNAAKDLHSFSHSSTAAAHDSAIASNASDPVFPAFAVSA